MEKLSVTATQVRHSDNDTAALASWEKAAFFCPEDFLRRYARKKKLLVVEARAQVLETVRFLWVCAERQNAGEGPSAPSARIDECWHEFVLHTGLYAQFCQRYLGQFIHHAPSDRNETEKYAETRAFAERFFGGLDPVMWPPALAADYDSGSCRDYCSDNACSDGHE